MDAQNSWPRVLKAHRLLLSVLLVIVTGAFTSEKWSLIPSQTHVIVPRSPLLADNNDRMRCHENFIFLFISGTTNYGTIKWIMWVNWLITQNGLSDRLFKFFLFFLSFFLVWLFEISCMGVSRSVFFFFFFFLIQYNQTWTRSACLKLCEHIIGCQTIVIMVFGK
jgi:hypothetical protein